MEDGGGVLNRGQQGKEAKVTRCSSSVLLKVIRFGRLKATRGPLINVTEKLRERDFPPSVVFYFSPAQDSKYCTSL